MGYLKEFQAQISNRDFAKFMQLWEEYCTSDSLDIEEVTSLLKEVKGSDFAKPFGRYVETLIPLWQQLENPEDSYAVLRLIIDLQTTNTAELAELALAAIKKKYGEDAETAERLKKVGLRTKDNFQSALAHYDLLAHIKKGNFVFHSSGWGVGEIMDFSPVREQLVVEFENVSGLKHITYTNAFKALIPLPSDHFLARRFSEPDKFEEEAKADPIAIFKLLLKDLGPKNASEIKDELCDLVIPEKDWQKWWQNTRAKIKKDTEIESPENLRDPFILRKTPITHETQFLAVLKKPMPNSQTILVCYNFIRDHGGKIKQAEINQAIVEKFNELMKNPDASEGEILQACFCLGLLQEKDPKAESKIEEIISKAEDLDALLSAVDIVAFKKQALIAIKNYRKDWPNVFLHLLHTLPQGMLKDYLYKELSQSSHKNLLEKALHDIAQNPANEPEFFFWYFMKLMSDSDKTLAKRSKEEQLKFAESFLVLLHRIENKPEFKDLVKRMYVTLSNGRYALVRQLFDGSTLEFTKEFLLLASKCHSLSDHDLKILRSLAEVVHTSLKTDTEKSKSKAILDSNTLWTTQEGYFKTQERIKHIGTKEVVENAREVEAARALGDLRENSEYKAAVEKRRWLQGELKTLSQSLSKARVITPEDVPDDEVGVGSVVHIEGPQGKKEIFTILGPWEANPDQNIFSYQSKLAQSMIGLQVKDTFQFKDEEYKILKISTIFNK